MLKRYVDICEMVDGRLVRRLLPRTAGMIKEELELAELHDNIVVKVPMIPDGIKAIRTFTDRGIPTNCTLVFSAGQALLAAKAGATFVSPFIGRVDDSNWDGMELIEQIVEVYANYGFETQILAASIRSPLHIVKCAESRCECSNLSSLFHYGIV